METSIKHPIKQIREDYKLTQGELGTICDVSASFVAQWECGYSRVPMGIINELCKYIKEEADQLFNDIEQYREEYKKGILLRLK